MQVLKQFKKEFFTSYKLFLIYVCKYLYGMLINGCTMDVLFGQE